ncbi:hypothetical protein V6N12_048919 [Hibiscus sabdariffa]|uniref:DNA-directed RNA polymerase n=1 Tax=Hibiscus sabdariffa TaxID=183260 RepID=A0ABR2EIP4_9ROSI
MSDKFDVLNTIEVEHEDIGAVEPVVGQGDSVRNKMIEKGAVVGDKITSNNGNQDVLSLLGGSRTQNMDGSKVVVSNEIIVPSKVTLNSNNHMAARVVERGSDISSKKATGRKALNEVHVANIKSGQPLSIGKNVVQT